MTSFSQHSMMDVRILLLSPHADDVAYSLGGVVAQLSMQADLHLLTIFGQSGWALPQASGEKSAAAISAEREQEDRAYCGRRRMGYKILKFPDSFIMGYDQQAELSSVAADDLRTPDVVKQILYAVSNLAPQIVIAPCGLGGHVDHQIVRIAADMLEDVDVLYYEDLPYSSKLSLSEIERQLSNQCLTPAMTIDITSALQGKCEDMRGYRSQTSESTITEMLLHAARIGAGSGIYAERLWRRIR